MHSTDNVQEGGETVGNVTGRTTGPVASLATTGLTTVAVSAASNPPGGTAGPRECAGCGKRITERFLLKALDLYWHEDCLKCGCCDCRLGEVGSTLYTKANLILCKRDYLRLFGTTGYCAACNKVIPAFEMVMRAKSNVYHLECFACQQCNHRFCVGDRFYLCENKILCEYDYEERLVFANMAYNPTSLAHIRRQVSNLQPATTDHLGIAGAGGGPPGGGNTGLSNTSGAAINDNFLQQRCDEMMMSLTPSRTSSNCYTESKSPILQQRPLPVVNNSLNHNNNNNNHQMNRNRDDGSSGYGSPDSDTFDTSGTQVP